MEMKRFSIGIHVLASVSLKFVQLDIIGTKMCVSADACTQLIHVQKTAIGMTACANAFVLSLKPVHASPAIIGTIRVASVCALHLKQV